MNQHLANDGRWHPVGPPPMPPKRKTGPLGYVVWGAFGVVAVALIASAVAPRGPKAAAPPDTTDAPTSTSPPETLPPSPPTTRPAETVTCQPADPIDVAAINAGFRGDADHLGPAVMAVDPRTRARYVAADILTADGSLHSSRDVWLFDGAVAYALSSGARSNSILPDGRRLGPFSAGDDYGVAVQACVATG